jgi:predicted metal-dependent phosphoesterase TrpH
VKKAKRFGYQAIAITDHDTVDGLKEALLVAEELDLEVIPGIEINTQLGDHEVHILGYFIDYQHPELLKRLKYYKRLRVERVHKIIQRLQDMGFTIDFEDVIDFAGDGAIGRSHIARAMKKNNFVDTTSEAFDRYIAIGKPAYVNRERMSPMETIKLIKKYNGIPVLAHPGLIGSDKIVKKMIKNGVEGLEVYYYEHSDNQEQKYRDLALDNDLLITGGSDDHGPGNKDGFRLGKVKLDYEFVENMKQCINKYSY